MRFPLVLLPLLLALIATPSLAAPDDLPSLAAQLAKLRTTHGANEDRDVGPELTPVKQALRAWVESRLPPVTQPGPDKITGPTTSPGLTALVADLNRSLSAAGVTCGEPGATTYRCASDPMVTENDRGYLEDVQIRFLPDGEHLLVVTGVGVKCGFDQSVYVYDEGLDHKWRLLLASEQDRYGADEYTPQNFMSIDVAPSAPGKPPLVATMGYAPSCQSAW